MGKRLRSAWRTARSSASSAPIIRRVRRAHLADRRTMAPGSRLRSFVTSSTPGLPDCSRAQTPGIPRATVANVSWFSSYHAARSSLTVSGLPDDVPLLLAYKSRAAGGRTSETKSEGRDCMSAPELGGQSSGWSSPLLASSKVRCRSALGSAIGHALHRIRYLRQPLHHRMLLVDCQDGLWVMAAVGSRRHALQRSLDIEIPSEVSDLSLDAS